jgi:methyl-accepting chemotaxis protein
LNELTSDIKAFSLKIDDHTEKITKIKKAKGSAKQFRAAVLVVAKDVNTYSGQVEELLPDLNKTIESLESNFSNVIDLINPSEPESEEVVRSSRLVFEQLITAVRGTKDGVGVFRTAILHLQQNNLAAELNKATNRLLTLVAGLLESFEEMESFGLRVTFRLNEKFGAG